MVQPIPSDYTKFYEPVARNISIGIGIVDGKGNVAIRYPPGYPLILSQIFSIADYFNYPRLKLIAVFNVLSSAATALFIFLIALLIFSERVAILSSLLWITYPFNLWLIRQPNSEVPFLLLLYLGIWIFFLGVEKENFPLSVITGFIIALASLVRPVSILIIFIFVMATLFFKKIPKMKRLMLACFIIVGFIITLLPWEFHVYSRIGQVIPLSSGGPPSIIDGLTFALDTEKENYQEHVSTDVLELMRRIKVNTSEVNSSMDIFKYLHQEMIEKPLPVLKLFALKLCRSWYGTDSMRYENYIIPIQILYLLLGFMGILIGFWIFKERTHHIFLLISIIFYFWAMTALVLPILRYMIPTMGCIFILSAIPINFKRSR